jgi:glycosyltransferase involved in cell wall biosynthesis
MISIVIPLYNKEHQIANTLQSVFGQTFTDFEIIIVDDGSTDNSSSVVSSINDTRIRLIHQNNAGVSVARNRGIAEAHGEFVAFLDADDEWKPDYLATQVKLVEEYPQCDIFATNYEFCNDSGKVTSTIIRRLPFNGTSGILSNYFEVASNSHPPLWTSAVMVRKSAIESIGGFPIGIKSGEDLLTWARLFVNCEFAFCTDVLAIYNLGDGYNFSNLPPRRQDIGDPVGIGLKQISHKYITFPKNKGLRQYISHWHKMRASVAIRYGDSIDCLCETMKSLFYNPLNFKAASFILLVIIPPKFRRTIISLKNS